MTFSKFTTNRPLKFGQADRREFIVEDSEVSLVVINDANANPIFLGRAKAGVATSEDKWQIRKITYDTNEGVTRIQWPESSSIASTDYEFVWSSVSNLSVTAATKASPCVVTVSSLGSLENGDKVIFQNVGGMTELDFTGSNIYTVANIDSGAKTFELSGIDSSAYTTYTSGGSVEYGEVVNYTYS